MNIEWFLYVGNGKSRHLPVFGNITLMLVDPFFMHFHPFSCDLSSFFLFVMEKDVTMPKKMISTICKGLVGWFKCTIVQVLDVITVKKY